MAADGMDKTGRNSPDSASEELFNLSQQEDGTRDDRKETEEVDPPASSNAASQEIVDLPNIHFGSKVGGMDADKDGSAASSRQKDDQEASRPREQRSSDTEAAGRPDGRLTETAPGAEGQQEDGTTEPSDRDGDTGLGRGTTVVRPIGPIASAKEADTAKAVARDAQIAKQADTDQQFQTDAAIGEGDGGDGGSGTTPTTPPSGGAPTISGASFAIAESAVTGDSVGAVTATDPDAGDTLSYAITSGNADGAFAIDPATGQVTIANGALLDYETMPARSLTVTVTDSGGNSDSATVSISVTDAIEAIGGVSDTDAAANTLSENATGGTVVGITAFASDPDTADTVSYSLSDDAGGLFQIDPASGVVTVAPGATIDFETATSHSIEVTATSTDGSTSTQIFSIGVTDDNTEFTVSAISDTNAAANSVAENAAGGTVVGITAFASDADGSDTVSYSLSDDAGGLFQIDPASGVVTVAPGATIDFETATSHSIEVTATSTDGSTSTQTFSIGVTDDNSEFTVSAITDTNAAANSVAENATGGTVVGITAFASDADGSDTVSYSLSDDAGGLFQIDPASGVVTVAPGATIDFETATSHSIEVTATSTDGSTSTQTFSIGVTDDNTEFTVSAITDTNAAANTVAENATGGTVVGITAFASDADGSDTVSYSLSDDAGGLFQIDPASGVVTVAPGASIDFETATSHSIEVTATSTDGSTSTQTFAIGVTDDNTEFTVSAISDTNAAVNTVAENATGGTVVGITAFASDADGSDTVSYSLSDDAGGRFQIDPASGVVTVAPGATIDFETATSHSIEVTATSTDGSTSTQTFAIGVTDDNTEFTVSAISDTNAAANSVAENATGGTVVGITAFATDPDASDTVSYSLSDDAGGLFQIDPASGVVTVAPGATIDFETATSHSIEVTATSTDGSTSTQTFSIGVTDDNSEFTVSAITDTNAAANSVAENATGGTVVGITAFASDADGSDTVSYSLSDDAGGLFQIDPASGVVTVAPGATIDFETATSHSIEVTATSTDGSTSTQTFSIGVTDDNSEFTVSAISDTNAAANTVAENATGGTVVGITAFASDADGSDTVSYSLSDDAGGLFQIDPASGVVTVAPGASIDFETATSHSIEVTATSTDGSTSTQTFAIGVTDDNTEFAVSAISDTNAAANTVAENATGGTVVGITAFASDADGSDTVSYSLSDDAGGLFQIDPASGVVTVAPGATIDFETATSHSIEVTATSTDGSTSTQSFSIGVTDDNTEFAVSAISDTNAAANSVTENATGGTVVGITAFASDADGSDTVSYSLSDDAGGLFQINPASGVVTVAPGASIDFETATSHSIEVTATSTDGSTSTQTFSIGVTDDNTEFTVSAISDTNAAANSIAENATGGTVVGITAFASDADGSDTVSYSLSDDAGGLFQIDPASGVVTVAPGATIDFETTTSHSIEVTATSTDGSTSTQTFSIGVTDDNSEFTVSAITDTNTAANSVAENATGGTVVGITAFASDADGSDTISYSLSDDAGGLFQIDPASGVVTVAPGATIDFETATSHSIEVTATSTDGSTSTQTFSIGVTDDNTEFTVSAISDTNAAANLVAENATGGTVVGITAFASDADGSDTVSYSLSDDAGGLFQIDPASGVVTVAPGATIDFETTTSHSIEVTATSTDGSTSTQTFSIGATDDNSEFTVSAITDTDAAANSVAENATGGTVVGITAFASDADGSDTVSYSLSDDAGGLFQIDPASGVVTVAPGATIDFETATSHSIEVTATSTDGSTSTQTFSIGVTDVSESGVGIISDTNAAANSVAENATGGTVVGITAFATDPDASDTVSYSLSDDAGGLFQIDPASGVVTVAPGATIDFETATSHSIEVTATSTDGSTSTQTFSIGVTDDNTEFTVSAISDTNAAANSVAENATGGTVVGITAFASDADGSDTVSYSLSDDAGGLFQIDPASGVVTVAPGATIDFETATSHSIEVTATSTDGSTSTQIFSIGVTDDNTEFTVSAISDTNAAANSVAENATGGTIVGITAFASDADGSDTVSYSLSDDAGGLFQIDPASGVVTVAPGATIDFETATSHSIEVTATSTDGSTSTQTFAIGVTDDTSEFTVSAISDTNAAANSVAENATGGTVVGITAFASDADGSDTVSYSLSDDAGGLFQIDPASGVVTVAPGATIDFETATSHSIEVTATSTDGSTSTQTFSIGVTDDNSEFTVSAITDTNAAANSVAENATGGTIVGITAFASDADGSDTVSYSLSDDAGGLFQIDPASGVVTVAPGATIDFETATSHSIEVTATSTDGSTSTQTFAIGVTDDNTEFTVSAISDTNAAANSVAENATGGTIVGITAFASDADGSDTVSYSLSDDAGGLFQIDPASGVVTVAPGATIDFETATSHSIEVTATSTDGSTSTQIFSIGVTDDNTEFTVSAISDTNAAANSVAENATGGTVVGITAFASDADGSDTVSYSLSDDAGGLFQIDPASGVVTVAPGATIDFETATSHSIEVTATSTDGSTSTQTFSIGVTDDNSEFTVSAISDTNAAANSVAENATGGTVVGITAFASDADGSDTVSYSLSDDAGGLFQIDPASGVVTVAPGASIDFETATSHSVEVTATSTDGSTSTQAFAIGVTDDNTEFTVSAISDTNAAANSVAENATGGTVVGITAFASDADGSDTVSYSLSDDAGGLFQIDPASGVVTVAPGATIDFETATSHSIEVTATSTDGSTSTQSFSIGVTDDNTEFTVSAISDTNAAANSVAENATGGTVVGITAFASDADGSDTVSYSLSDDAGGLFQIDPASGVVTVAPGATIDFETATSLSIEVTATSTDGSTSTQTFAIGVTDDNTEFAVSAISDTNAAANSVTENATGGTVVGITAFASDADGSDTVSYSLSDDAGGLFQIDPASGVVTVAPGATIDFETATSHSIEVTATSTDGSTSTQTFAIGVTDDNTEFTVSAISDTNAAANSVAENATGGTVVGITAFASDADGSDTVSYSLSDDAGGLFQIDPASGVVTVAPGATIDFETATSLSIEVTATSTDGSTSTQTFAIGVTDDNTEFAVSAITDTNAAANSVAENATGGTIVGITAFASDADGSDTVSYSLSDDAGGRFQIDPASGVVTVAPGATIDFETATSHSIEVTATSTDGSTSTQTFAIGVTDDNTEFTVSAISDTNAAANSVAENATGGTVVGITAFASDADGSDTVSYSLSDDAGGLFQIDPASGVVTVAPGATIDFETATSHSIEVTATSTDGSTSTQTFSIGVTDDNTEFTVSAISDTNAAANSVAENATGGTVVGITAFASDADGSDTVSYSLSDDAGGLFQIDPASGVVTVTPGATIDFETATSHSIEVTATSTDGSTSTQAFSIGVTDDNTEFAVSAISDTNAAANSVTENATGGTVVGITAFASDADGSDTVSYSLSDDAGGLFQIDPASGVVTVAPSASIDFETATSHSIEVTATSTDGSTSTQTFSIGVTDDNTEFTVSAISDTNAAANTVAENATGGTVVGITAFASDADGSDTVSYSLSDDAGGRFQIDPASGVVTVAPGATIDFETATSHSIEVTATSTDGSTSTQIFSIGVTDDNTEFTVSAISDTNAAANSVAENATGGTVVGITAFASDADGSDTISYSLSDDAGGLFQIDPASGVVTVAPGASIDFETATSHSIEVTATSTDGSTSTQTFSIGVTDDNTEFTVSAISDTNAAANSVAENATGGTVVGITAFASDADGSDTVSYSLSDDAGGLFQIDPASGVVTVAPGATIDFETATSHSIEVTATSTDGSTSTQTFSIGVTDDNTEFTVSAISDTNAAANSIAENATGGTVVGITAFASDADGSDTVSYSLSDDAGGLFQIDPASGVVTVAPGATIDFETATSHSIEVTATSTDGSTSTQTFSIGVTDDNTEFTVSAISDTNAAANSVAENATGGTVVGITAFASDADGSDTVSYSLSDDAGGRFQIDPASGVVTVAPGAAIDFETATSHSIEVTATSTDGSTSTQTFSIGVTDDTSEFSVSAITDSDAAANTVDENVANGTVVGITALATDADGSDSVTYSLSDDAGGRFTIDSSSGQVTVADGSLLDHETNASHTITVQATSTDGSTSTETFTINVADLAENPPTDLILTASDVGTGDTYSNTVEAHDPVGYWRLAEGGSTVVTDETGANNGNWLNTTTGDLSGPFSGISTVATDFDGTNDHVVIPHSSAFDLPEGTVDFWFNPDTTTSGSLQGLFSVNSTNQELGSLQIYQDDGGIFLYMEVNGGRFEISTANNLLTAGQWHNLSFSWGSGGMQLYVDGVDVGSNGGYTGGLGNADQDPIVIGAATFSSNDGETDDLRFFYDGSIAEVALFDTALDATQVGDLITAGTNGIDLDGATMIVEGAADGTSVGTLTTVDADPVDTHTYSLTDDAGGRFAVNATTGEITVADGSLIDYETTTSHDITVEVTDSAGFTYAETFTIQVENNFAPTDLDLSNATVDENSANGTVVGTASTTDPNDTDSFTYSLTDDAGGRFAIDPNTGEITVADGSLLDHETNTSHDVTIEVTDSDGNTYTEVFTINVGDVSEFAPTDMDLSGNGISINEGGGNAHYLQADDGGAVFGGLTTFTAELQFTVSTEGSTFTPLYSYAVPGNTTTANELVVGGGSGFLGGDLGVWIKGTAVDTGIPRSTVFDGQPHQLSVTWDSSTGTLEVYIDGQQQFTTTGVETGQTLSGGGTLILGQEQDSPGGGFDSNQAFAGTYGDFRVFDDVRTATEISDNIFSDVDPATGGLVADWRMNDLNGGVTTETVSGNDLTVNTATGTGFTTGTAPTLIAPEISEAAANGTVVGILSTTDADTGDTHTYSLTDDAGGRFAVNATTGEITVANAGLIDYETSTSHNITVEVTDSGGMTYSETFSISVTDCADTAMSMSAASFSGSSAMMGGSASDTITGGAGDDTLIGNAGADTLIGNAGADTLIGNDGNDTLIGGAGGASSTGDTYVTQVESHGPVAHWRLGEGSGTSAADQVGTHPGSYANGVGVGSASGPFTGISTTAADFDGSNDYVEVPHSSDFALSEGTIQLWFNVDNTAGQYTLMSMESSSDNDGMNLRVKDNYLEFNVKGGGSDHFLFSNSGSITAGQWHSVALTWGSGGLELYLDGTLVDSDPYTGGLPDIGEPITIGASQKSSDDGQANNLEDFFDGQIAEVAVFDSALSETQIDALIDSGVNGSEGGSAGDTLDGGGGIDTASYGGSLEGIYVDLDAGTATGGDAEGDTLTNIENLTGSDFADTLIGDANANVLDGGAGNDTLRGGDGNDTLIGGAGNDVAYGEAGDDTYVFSEGDLGSDQFYGGAGWADEIAVMAADGGSGPVDGPWTVEIDGGATTTITDASGVLNLTADSSGTITLADGSELVFEGVDRITW